SVQNACILGGDWRPVPVRGMDAPAKPAFCGATRSKKKGFWERRRLCFGGFAAQKKKAAEERSHGCEFLDRN
ncbi:MAG: hypothetical protein O7H39_11145, partial [Gammaproteobacteria bacterium]|nr:hypothetical protein [Gammaproteobacteria bacterium]